ncbi:ABC transporter permease [Dehalococcoidia bacterium]|nr:ABC transporter permease [Dehalococcoidia bacterium]
MEELFGAPTSTIALVLAALFAAAVLSLVYIGLRNQVLVRMAIRNVPRRPAQSILILLGMMLATVIISSAFTTGDSISNSIRKSATEDLRFVDQLVRIDASSEAWGGGEVPDRFPQTIFSQLEPHLNADPDIDGVLPAILERVSIVNLRTRQFETQGLFTGVDPSRIGPFSALLDTQGNQIDLLALGPNEVYLDHQGAQVLDAIPGDILGVALGPGGLHQLKVREISDGWFVKQETATVVLLMALAPVQKLLGQEGYIDYIAVSNRGGSGESEKLTSAVQGRLSDLPQLKEAGLELFPLKSEVVATANQLASLFVTIFTTFGLFSIGVGILLIFLIFSMLAAERKSEMGMSRAIGMQRLHLVRMFVVEGAAYGILSSLIGALVGIGVGFLLVIGVAEAFAQGPRAAGAFSLSPAVTLRSVLISFFAGSVVTFITVIFASRRTSRLNIVRAIRDIPEPQAARAGKGTLIWGVVLTVTGSLVTVTGLASAQLTAFGLGVSLIPIGIAMILRWKGVPQRLALSLVGLFLLLYWLLPGSVFDAINVDWNQDFSIFFVSGALVTTGAVLLAMNNSAVILSVVTALLHRSRRMLPIVKSAVSYPLRASFRTGLSVAMFAVVVFSIVVMSTITSGFNQLFDDQNRLGGGYEVVAFASNQLNPIENLTKAVQKAPTLSAVAEKDGLPAVGTLRTIRDAGARLSATQGALDDAIVNGVDNDFVRSNNYVVTLATKDFAIGSNFDSPSVWAAIRDNPGFALASATLFNTRNNFEFGPQPDFILDAEGLFIENDFMEPVPVTLRDRISGTEFEVNVIGAVDDLGFFLPQGLFVSSALFMDDFPRQVPATSFFFEVSDGVENPAREIEAAFFEHGINAVDINERLSETGAANSSVNNLLVGFMALGLVVGIAALGVISARAVVERRHHIGVMRAIGFSRGMVQMAFLLESSFIALLGIIIGLGLGLITSINVMNEISAEEPAVSLVIPWTRIALMCVGAYLFSLITTYLPCRQAGNIAPADALRYE